MIVSNKTERNRRNHQVTLTTLTETDDGVEWSHSSGFTGLQKMQMSTEKCVETSGSAHSLTAPFDLIMFDGPNTSATSVQLMHIWCHLSM